MTATAIKGRTTLFVPGDSGGAEPIFEGAFGFCGAGQAIGFGAHQLLMPNVRYDTNLAHGGPGLWNGISSSCTFRSDGYYLLVMQVYVRLNGGNVGVLGDTIVSYFSYSAPANHPTQVNMEQNLYGSSHYRVTWSYVDKFLTGESLLLLVENDAAFAATVEEGSISISKLGSVDT